jgi:ankyrin repeat protein
LKYALRTYASCNQTSAFYSAAELGRTDVVRDMVEKGADVNVLCNKKCSSHWTPLMIAAAEGHPETVAVLIKAGANVNVRNKYGRTALMFASKYGFTSIVISLLNAGADPDIMPNSVEEPTALIAASEKGHLEVVQALLAHSADPNIEIIQGYSPLNAALLKDHVDIVHALLKAGADPNRKNTMGNTPLLLAISDHSEIAIIMLDGGADPNTKQQNFPGFSALMIATLYGKIKVAKVLIAKGADIHATDMQGVNALRIARDKGFNEIVSLLRKAGAKD